MLTNSEKFVTWGLLGLIAFELYRQNNPPALASNCRSINTNPGSGDQIPDWIQDLSRVETGKDYFGPRCGIFGRCG